MELSDVVAEIEEDERLKDRIKATQIFKSMLNQPSLLSVSSANAVQVGTANGFSSFSVDLPRSVLDIESLQLLSTSIPQCNPSIPNTALTFWYYRLSEYSGRTPCLNNLYCVRLLPSYYPPEFVENVNSYGRNKTFPNYPTLATEMAKSTQTDLGYTNLRTLQTEPSSAADFVQYDWPFLPGDVSITYNSTYNKFQMTGNTTQFAYITWSSATTYILGNVVIYNNVAYKSLVAGNLNAQPDISPNSWTPCASEIIASWSTDPTYEIGNFVRYNNLLYIATAINRNIEPGTPGAPWSTLLAGLRPYRYFITGYDDPNVAIKQAELFEYPWDSFQVYEAGEKVVFQGRYLKSNVYTSYYTPGNVLTQAKQAEVPAPPGVPPPQVFLQGDVFVRRNANPDAWGDVIIYAEGDKVYHNNNQWISLMNDNEQNEPGASNAWLEEPLQVLTPNPVDAPIWTAYVVYNNGDLVYYKDQCYLSLQGNNVNENPETSTTFWRLQALHPLDAREFRFGLTYPKYSLVNYNDALYVAIIDGAVVIGDFVEIGRVAWLNYNYEVESNTLDEIAYYRGAYYYRTALGAASFAPVALNWDPAVSYPANVYVNYNGNTWLCRVANVNVEPTPLSLEWEDMGFNAWLPYTGALGTLTGLGGLSKLFDFCFLTNAGDPNAELKEFPAEIGGQPYATLPKRLLNSILGFTWNGVFDPEQFPIIITNINRRVASLYNRVRPVPDYDLILEGGVMLGSVAQPVALSTYTYTADGYANLVYSSIINIYTNIVSAATMDTMRDTNLIATTSMNCGNLGIAFHANYIDTPLIRIAGGDIDTLLIELRDEFGDPFYLTNNAVMTATFKINYRNQVRVE